MSCFSVIVPVYNVASYLGEALDSVYAQTFPDWECHGVDDGSKDESNAILDDYVRHDGRFKIVHQRNGGVSSARNRALDRAQGEWLCFLDGDDIYNVETLAFFNRYMEMYPHADVLGGQLVRFATEINWLDDRRNIIQIEQNEILPDLLFMMGFCQFAYSCELGKALRGFSCYSLGEDTLYALERFVRSKVIIVFPNVVYGYRQRKMSAMHDVLTLEKLQDSFNASVRRLEVLLDNISRVSKPCLRRELVHITEWASIKLSAFLDTRGKYKFIKDRYRIFFKFSNDSRVPIWFRLTMYCSALFQWRWMEWVLMKFPYKLKIKLNELQLKRRGT